MALRLFDVSLRSILAKKEAQAKKPLSPEEIDQYIDSAIGARRLDRIKREAAQVLTQYGTASGTLNYIADTIDKEHRVWTITKIGAWRGFCGNVLTAIVVLIIAISYHLVEDTDKAKHAVEYYHRCLASIFH